MHRYRLPALALAATLHASAASAQSTIETPPGSGIRFPGVTLINPATGLPYAATGGGSGGTSGALPPQGVTMTNTNPQVQATAATQVLGFNASRKYLQLQNLTGGDCRENEGAAAGQTAGVLVPNRGTQTFEASAITFQAISVWCAQAGEIAIKEGQ